jgi:hypothetical protein
MNIGPEGATLRVSKVLKGSVTSNTIKIEDSLCYASLTTSDMKPQHTYILPLPEHADGLYAEKEPSNGRYVMPGCAHSGMELRDGKLYTFELTNNGRRRLQFFGEYSHFVGWRPVAEVTANFKIFLLASLGIAFMQIGPVGGLVLFGICVALAVVFLRSAPELRRRLIVLVVTLPILWMLIGLSGAAFRSDISPVGEPPYHPSWQSYPPLIGLVLFFSFAVIYIKRIPASWSFSVPYSLVNAYFAVMMFLFSEAGITGLRL